MCIYIYIYIYSLDEIDESVAVSEEFYIRKLNDITLKQHGNQRMSHQSNWSSTLKPDTNLGWEYHPRVISITRPRKRSCEHWLELEQV
jgi:hypothetical protein